jgi:hypothetical protein
MTKEIRGWTMARSQGNTGVFAPAAGEANVHAGAAPCRGGRRQSTTSSARPAPPRACTALVRGPLALQKNNVSLHPLPSPKDRVDHRQQSTHAAWCMLQPLAAVDRRRCLTR